MASPPAPAWQELFEAEADLPQKAAPKRRLAAPKATDDDDDWGNDDLTDVLPPMWGIMAVPAGQCWPWPDSKVGDVVQ